MPIFNRVTLVATATCLSLSVTLLTSETAKAQTQDLVLEDKFDAAFIVVSPSGRVVSHQASNLTLGQASASLNSNSSLFSNLKLSTNIQRVASGNYNLDFLLTTDSNSGFIPPGTTLRGEAINEWRFDLGNSTSSIDNGINFSTPVTYNSAQGSWFDDGNLVVPEASYLPQLNDGSTPTELLGLFDIGVRSGDLGAFGNGIDTFSLKVNVTLQEQTTPAVPEPSIIGGLLISASLGLAFSRRHKGKKVLI
ncbi:MAG: PEP-CTERM sorting domain-containing protein [Desmonostoc vinosum HA7617-LM4]|jgi:hypothetical protein|nr:PEP-CTERM sorting domain-containing protein [Desmonostoc vinosum HA7617-LM4]